MNLEDKYALLEYWIEEEELNYAAVPFDSERNAECMIKITEILGEIALIEMSL